MPAAFFVTWASDSTGRGCYMSSDWEESTGQPVLQSRGMGWLSMIHPGDADETVSAWNRAVQERTALSIRYRLQRRAGAYSIVHAAASPSFSLSDGRFLGHFGSVMEIDPGSDGRDGHAGSGETVPAAPRSEETKALLSALSEQLLACEGLVKRLDDEKILTLLRLTLLEVGRRMAASFGTVG